MDIAANQGIAEEEAAQMKRDIEIAVECMWYASLMAVGIAILWFAYFGG